MTDISSIFSKQNTMRSSTAILKSILNKDRTPEPGMMPLLTGDGFRTDDSFVANIARLVMEMRGQNGSFVTKAVASESQGVQGKYITVKSADAGKIFGDTGNDKITINSSRVDYVSARSGDDEITITATGEKNKVSGLSALDSGSVTRIYGGDGKDTIDISAEELVSEVQGGNGDDAVTVKSSIASRITGGEGNDTIAVIARSVEGVEGNAGDDQISILATVDPELDDKLQRSSDSGSVRKVLGGVGKDTIVIDADRQVTGVDAGSGDDSVTIRAKEIYSIDAGSGNDTVDLTGENVAGINTGSGDDTVSAKGSVISNLFSGYGADKIDLEADYVFGVDGGSGNDAVFVESSSVLFVNSGSGNDNIEVHGHSVSGILGDAGDDTIKIYSTPSKRHLEETLKQEASDYGVSNLIGLGKDISGSGNRLDQRTSVMDQSAPPIEHDPYGAEFTGIRGGAGKDIIEIENQFGTVRDVDGGTGNDTITITAHEIGDIRGGKGDDTLNLQSQSSSNVVSVYFAEGDGNDTINTTNDIEIRRYSADGTRELGLKDAKLTKVEGATDTYKLTFNGSKDSITIHYYEPGIRPDTVVPTIEGNSIKWVPKTDTKA